MNSLPNLRSVNTYRIISFFTRSGGILSDNGYFDWSMSSQTEMPLKRAKKGMIKGKFYNQFSRSLGKKCGH